jgi:hypothetical protein
VLSTVVLAGDKALGPPCMSSAKMAVKKGVVAPIAWLKLTGMYLSDKFPRTMVKQNMLANSATLYICCLLFMGFMGVHLPMDSK